MLDLHVELLTFDRRSLGTTRAIRSITTQQQPSQIAKKSRKHREDNKIIHKWQIAIAKGKSQKDRENAKIIHKWQIEIARTATPSLANENHQFIPPIANRHFKATHTRSQVNSNDASA